MKETMRAAVVEAPHKLVLKEIPVPQITDDEVLVQVSYCGICGSDWSIYTGKYAAEKLPLITGHEMFGTIAAVGKRAKGIKVGDRVAVDICLPCGTCYFCRKGDGLLCETFTQLGIHTNGGFAEYVKAPWQNIYPVPDEIDDYTATFVEPMTAVLQASKRLNADIASSCVVIGSGLGVLHAKLALLRGCSPVILLGRSEKRLRLAREMGVDYTINVKEVADPVAEVKRLTGGLGADYVIEAVGTSQTYEQAFAMLRRGGKLSAFGICAGDDYAKLPPYEFVLGEKKVTGSCAGIGNDWGDAIKLLQYKRVEPLPLLSMVVPLEELETALHEIRQNPKLFKVFVSPLVNKRMVIDESL